MQEIADLEDELIEMKMRFEDLDCMSESDPKFNEDEYENLETTIEMKEEMLHDARSRLQISEMVNYSK